MFFILFRRRISLFKKNRLCVVILCNFSCGTEIYNAETPILSEHQVVRCQISVQDVFSVHLFQPLHNRKEHISRFLKRKRFFLAFQIMPQAGYPQVFHDNIGISLFFKVIQNLYNFFHRVQRGHHSCLPQEVSDFFFSFFALWRT